MELTGIVESDADSTLSDDVSQLKFMVSFLDNFKEKESMWQRLKNGLPEITQDTVKEVEKNIDFRTDYKELRKLEKSIKEINLNISEIARKIEEYGVIREIKLSKSDLKFARTEILIGRLQRDHIVQVENNKKIYMERLTDHDHPIVAIFYLKKDMEEVEKTISELNFHRIAFPRDKTPLDKIKKLKEEIKKSEEKIESYNDDIKKKFLCQKFNYEVLLDIYENRSTLEIESKKTGRTKYLSIISGWIPYSCKDEIVKLLKKDRQRCYIEFFKPQKNDEPPVILKNGPFSNSFEVVTNLYGTPSYDWVDPTPYLAPFFALFFGLCLTDAGYGFIVAGLCLWSIKKLKLAAGAKKFMFLLFWGGVASIITGALTGGWFGNAFSNIKVIDNLKIIDPLKKPQYFLYFSVLLGYIHVIFGMILSLIQNIKTGFIKAALYEELPWLVILLSIPVYFMGGIFNGIGKISISAGIAGVVLFSGYKSRNIFARLGAGLYNLYGGTDYVKDMISYSRLFALGMGTGILAMAINEMSAQAAQIPIIGYFLVVFILIGGHIFNIAMNVLSSYVHSSRLQYVEFFTKFFKGGGKSFSPFTWKNNKVSLIGGSLWKE